MNQLALQPDSPNLSGEARRTTLRKIVLVETGQDVFRCQGCGSCNTNLHREEMDVSLESLVQLALQNDEEVFTCQTLWSDEVLGSIQYACQRGLDLRAVILALRQEAVRRNMWKEMDP